MILFNRNRLHTDFQCRKIHPAINIGVLVISTIYMTFISCHVSENPIVSRFSDTLQVDDTSAFVNANYVEPTFQPSPIIDTNTSYFLKTVTLFLKNQPTAFPALRLLSDEKLTFSMDDLQCNTEKYYYKIVHCTSNWQMDNLSETFYYKGNSQKQITEFSYSRGTKINYTHYEFSFPPDDEAFISSGNYLLQIFSNDDDETPLIVRRFVVYDNLFGIDAIIHPSNKSSDNWFKQAADITVTENIDVPDPYSSIKLVVLQNGRWDNALRDLAPRFVRNKELIFDFEPEDAFNGGDEFRYFNIGNLQKDGSIKLKNTFSSTDAFLSCDQKRTFLKHKPIIDINGSFIINGTSYSPQLEMDYYTTHFCLKTEKIEDGSLYVFGKCTDWQVKKNFIMSYNDSLKSYTTSVLLKQGYYNYEYLWVNNNGEQKEDVMEGNHASTENDYYILVYFHNFSKNTDLLYGFLKTNSSH